MLFWSRPPAIRGKGPRAVVAAHSLSRACAPCLSAARSTPYVLEIYNYSTRRPLSVLLPVHMLSVVGKVLWQPLHAWTFRYKVLRTEYSSWLLWEAEYRSTPPSNYLLACRCNLRYCHGLHSGSARGNTSLCAPNIPSLSHHLLVSLRLPSSSLLSRSPPLLLSPLDSVHPRPLRFFPFVHFFVLRPPSSVFPFLPLLPLSRLSWLSAWLSAQPSHFPLGSSSRILPQRLPSRPSQFAGL